MLSMMQRGREAACRRSSTLALPTMNLLTPIGALYGTAVRLRAWGYRAGILSTTRLQAPVISVGNLSMGGTGKTPTTIALGRMLLESGRRVAILSRGYKGSYGVGPLLVSDGRRIHPEQHRR